MSDDPRFKIEHRLVLGRPRYVLSQKNPTRWWGSRWDAVGIADLESQALAQMQKLAEFRVTTKWYDKHGDEDVGSW